jgi:hypothetical protein
MLYYMGLRRYGIGGDHLDTRQFGCLGCRYGYFHTFLRAHRSSSTIDIAPGLHSLAQIPQPLQ